MAETTSRSSASQIGDGSATREPAVLVVDPDLRLVWVNQPFEELLGSPPGALVGRSLGEITHADDAGIGLDVIRRAFNGDLGRYQLLKRYLRADGSPVPVRVEVAVLDDPNLGLLAVGTVHPVSAPAAMPIDATDAVVRQVREEQRTLALVHETGVIADEADTRQELLERTLRALCVGTGSSFALAYDCRADDEPILETEVRVDEDSSVEAVQRCLRLPGGDAQRARRVRCARRILVDDGEAMLTTRTRTPCVTRWMGIPIGAGDDITGVIELFATRQIDVGQGLVAALNDVGAHLGRALERLQREADAIAQAAQRMSFAATAAHELRNPVAAATLALSSLGRRGDRLDDADRATLFSVVERSLAQLSGLVTSLGELAKLDGVGLREPLVDVDLVPVLVGALADLELALDRRLEIDVPASVPVRCSIVGVTAVIGNLVTNAARHGCPTITVTARAVAGTVVVEVVDDGPGVPDTVEARVFEPFSRGDARAAGLGLGLAISRRLALAMGGTLTHQPVQPHGARFVLTLQEAA